MTPANLKRIGPSEEEKGSKATKFFSFDKVYTQYQDDEEKK